MNEEQRFKDLYVKEYESIIEEYSSKLLEVKEKYPDRVHSQYDYYYGLILNNVDGLVEFIVSKHNINLSNIFGEDYSHRYMINKLILKTWSIKLEIIKSFDDFYEGLQNYIE